MSTRWRIDELQSAVADALVAAGYEAPENGQVSPIPSRRSIRYYSTLGLLDRPADMEGRTALYDERHLLQLCAIKRLQVKGISLADIQEQLAGLDDGGLRDIARVDAAEAGPRAEPARRGEDFWAAAPAAPPAPAAVRVTEAHAPSAEELQLYSALDLDEGLTLLIKGPLDERGAAVLKAAAARLVRAARELNPDLKSDE
jgi:DNA-binding transcriptional MerR regulator